MNGTTAILPGFNMDTTTCFPACTEFFDEVWHYGRRGMVSIGKTMGSLFSGLEAMRQDTDAFCILLRIARIGIAVFQATHGNFSALARYDGDLQKTNALCDGLQFFAAIDAIFSNEDDDGKERTVFENITIVALSISTFATGLLWLISMKIPVLGELSNAMGAIKFLATVADATAAKGFFSNALDAIMDFPDLDADAQWKAILKAGEGITVALAIIFGMVGMATICPVAMITVSLIACAFGVIRFIHKWQIGKDAKIE